MARRLSQQQRRRVEQHQARRLEASETQAALATGSDPENIHQGRIIQSHGHNLLLENDRGQEIPCLARQNLGPLVCGDQVLWQATGSGQGVIINLLPRASLFCRHNQQGRERPLAANIHFLILVLAPVPKPQPYLLDQYLISTELLGLDAIICLNKTDTLDEADMATFDTTFGHYERLGYPILKVSAHRGTGLDRLKTLMQDRTSILLGQSGVGKSSLAQALLERPDIKAGDLSSLAGKGRHTTTATRLYRLPEGGALIDSPGVRSFRPGGTSMTELEQGFREFRSLLGQCRFSNCRHQDEPHCALLEAMNQGLIHPQRLEHFRHMAAQLQSGR